MSLEPNTRQPRSDVVGLDSGLEALQASPEFRGPVEPLDGHTCNDHLAHIYENPAEQVATAVPFLRQGIERGERCLYVVDRLSEDDVAGAMRDAGVDVDRALESGQLSFHSVDETYLRTGTFEPDEMIEFYGDAVDEATEEYGAVRVAAETTWLEDVSTTFDEFMEYEAKVNDLFEGTDCIAICHYDRTALPPEVVRDVLRTHPHLIYDGTVCHNFYYTPPAEFFEPDEADRDVERMLGTLLERTEAKTELHERQQFLREQNEIVANPDLSFEEKLDRLLDLGCERFGMEIGALTRLSRRDGDFRIETAVGSDCYPDEGPLPVQPGDGCFCRRAISEDAPTAAPDVRERGWTDDPVHEEFGLTSYFGIGVSADGDSYGTLWFGDTSPRGHSFSEAERSFLELMGEWVSQELTRREHERYQRELYEITSGSDLPLSEKLDRLLELGCERLDLEVGLLASELENGYEIDRMTGTHPDLDEGTTIPTSSNGCCRQVISAVDTGSVAKLPAADGEVDALYDEFGLCCYVAVQVAAGEDRYGTICFTDSSPREREFTESELTFLELMGEWVSQELARRERERRLERHREYTDDILDAVDDVFYVLDEYGNLQRWNETAREVTGYDDAESTTMNALDFFDGDDEEAISEGIVEVFETGTGRVEAALRTRDGDAIPYEFVASALEDPDGNPVLTGIGRDVSERVARERAQRELYEITASKDLTFEEKIEQLLDLGRERFGLDQGYLTHYHPNEGIVENEYAVGPPDQDLRTGIPEAQAKPGQFCRRTVEADEPMGSTDVSELGWDDDPVYRESGLRSYFGVKVTDGVGSSGTLAFCDTQTREEPFTDAERTFLELMGQWVSHELEQRRRETQLAALNEMSRAVMGAKADEEIAEITVEYAEEVLELPLTAVVTYDGCTGELTPTAQSPGADDQLPTSALCGRDGGALWEAFVASEIRDLEDVASLPGAGDDITETLAVPLGQQGLFVTATTAPDGFSDTTREFAETMAATVEAAITRADREQQLQERERMLEEQNETLARLNRVNDIIRNIDQSLVQASTREEILTVVCEQLADAGPYEMAWIGEHDAVTEEITPVEWAGAEKGYLDEITVTADDRPTGLGPAGRAIRTHESQVVNDILQDDSFRPWRQEALNRGYHGCITLPLAYGDTLYGLAVVYASQPDVFGELERTVLDELSDTIAHAINAVESKKALVSDEVTRLEFEVEDEGLEVLKFARELDCSFDQESVVPRADGGVRAFYSTRGTPASEALEFADRLPALDVTLVSETEDDGEPVCLFESDLTEDSLTATMLTHGGQLQSFAVRDGTATVTVDIAVDAAVREFVEMFRTKYPDSELVAQRSLERPSRSPTEVHLSLIERLTDRQLEALQTAYFAGYFEEPRVQKGTDVAETMDVSQPTFTSHLRAAHRKIGEHLFE